MDTSSRIFLAGHGGLVGSAIARRLATAGFENVLTRTRAELDLTEQSAVRDFFAAAKPEYVYLAAARVGGIYANDTYRADFIRENLLIQTNVIDAAYREGASKLLFLGSSCIYPKFADQPIVEDSLLAGTLETTNEAYAVAKIAGITMCQSYARQFGFKAISLMPTNLYGPGDNFDLETSHVLPALLRKFHEAKLEGAPEVVVWGTGKPRRELLHVDDLADACLFLMENHVTPEIINVGTGTDVTVAELAGLIGDIVEYQGSVRFDDTKPDGTPRKVLDVSRVNAIGWRAAIGLKDGIRHTYQWYLEHLGDESQPPHSRTGE